MAAHQIPSKSRNQYARKRLQEKVIAFPYKYNCDLQWKVIQTGFEVYILVVSIIVPSLRKISKLPKANQC